MFVQNVILVIIYNDYEPSHDKTDNLDSDSRSNTKRPVQSQKMARSLSLDLDSIKVFTPGKKYESPRNINKNDRQSIDSSAILFYLHF